MFNYKDYYKHNKQYIDEQMFLCGISKDVLKAILNLDTLGKMPSEVNRYISGKDFCLDERDITSINYMLVANAKDEELAEKVYNNFKENAFNDLLDFDILCSRAKKIKQYLCVTSEQTRLEQFVNDRAI